MVKYIKATENKIWDKQCISWTKRYFCFLGILVAIIGVLTFIVYLSYGVNKRVGQSEYGVVRNKYTTKLHGPMEQGLYNNLTIGDTLYKYTATMQFLDFDTVNAANDPADTYVNCMTADGLLISLEVIIQYQYKRDEIIPVIWYSFNDEGMYTDFLTKTIYGIIYEDCAFFFANDYYSKRNLIENRVFESVTELFNRNESGITVFNVQLKNIIFPKPLVEVISTKQHLVQEIQTQYNNRTSLLINANTTYIQAEQEAQIIVINANNEANLMEKNANTTAENIYYKFQKMTEYFANVEQKFNFKPNDLIDYIYSTYAKTGAVFANL
jgi:regulator of protease activity HflC (stomatin/prohibitin superfamily)